MAIPTPYSYRQYTGDGVAKTFSIPFPYLERVHVHVFLDQKELKDGTDYNWTSGTQIQLLIPPQAPVAGTPPIPAQVLTVRRITPEDDQIVQWKDGSYIIQDDLNESDKQWLYLIQEHHDALMLLLNGSGSIPGGGNPAASLSFWNSLPRNKDPNKGTATELAQTIQKLDQTLGDWPKDGKDQFIATTDAISARLDPYVQDGVPAPYGLPQKEQLGKTWFDTDDLVQRFWDADAGAWVTLANTGPIGPVGPKGDNGGFGTPTATGLPAGSAPTVTASGPDTAKVFAFGLPKGDQGIQGIKGDTGPAAGFGTPTAAGLPAGSAPTVTASGPDTAKVFAFGIPAGAQGVQGTAAGFGVPTVTGLAAGATPTVTASGPDTAKVFAFGIPKGDKGDKGDTGPAATLPIASAATLGGVKIGTNVAIAADGTISANLPGALVYRGTSDLTATPPTTPAKGDVYLSNKAGTIAAGWTGIAGSTTAAGDMVLWDGAKWDRVGSTGIGVTTVTGSAPIKIAGTAAAPDVQVTDATATAKGVVQLATAAEAGAATNATKAVTPSTLPWKRTGTTLSPTTAGDVTAFSPGTAALPGLTPAGDPDTGITSPAANKLTITTKGAAKVTVDDFDGNPIIENFFPRARPTLDLPFALTKRLDPRVTFSRSSTGTYVDANGVIRTAAVNEARFDHDPATGESLGLLVEEQRMNVCLRSEEATNAAWQKNNVTVIADAVASPAGTLTADTVIPATSAGTHFLTQFALAAGQTYSVFVKPAGYNFVAVGDGGSNFNAVFDLVNGTARVHNGSATAGIAALAGGWFRIFGTVSGSPDSQFRIFVLASGGSPYDPFAGDGTSGIHVWGAQLEAGAFPTSYIPTTTAQVTRNADVAQITGTNFSSWFNSGQLTLFADYRPRYYPAGTGYKAGIWGFGGAAPRIHLSQADTSDRPIQGQIYDGTNVIGVRPSGTADLIVGSSVKVAFSFSGSSASITHNGLAVNTGGGSTPNISGITQSTIGDRPDTTAKLNSTISRLTYWPTRLSDATLQAITK